MCHAQARVAGDAARTRDAGRTTTSALHLCGSVGAAGRRRMVSFVPCHPAAAERERDRAGADRAHIVGSRGMGLVGTKHAAKCPRAINFNANTVTTHTLVIVTVRSYIF